MGIVQTAYCNGAASNAVARRGIECKYAKTGVKFCHHVALEFDIGIYFEANGHGTCLFNNGCVHKIQTRLTEVDVALKAVAGIDTAETAALLKKQSACHRLLATEQL